MTTVSPSEEQYSNAKNEYKMYILNRVEIISKFLLKLIAPSYRNKNFKESALRRTCKICSRYDRSNSMLDCSNPHGSKESMFAQLFSEIDECELSGLL